MTISIIGHGYVGLVTAAIFADLGNTVWVVGRDPEKIERLKGGDVLFYEPGLAEMVKRNHEAGRLIFTLDYAPAVKAAGIIFICVGTPASPSGEADLTSVFAAAEKIAASLTGFKVVVTKSTVPPGTNRKVSEIITKHKPSGATFAIASVPEFLREGTAISDTLHPDRVVIGTESEKAREALMELHKPIDGKTVLCNVETAELIKYASNSLLSTKISFANAIAILSERVGADAGKVLDGVGLDKRIGRSFLFPGVGYGGSCFPKDVKALIALSHERGYDFELLKAVEEINARIRKFFVDKIIHHFEGHLKGRRLAVLGLSFKPDTDDMRDAPSIYVIGELLKNGAEVSAYDPQAAGTARVHFGEKINYAKSALDAADGADAAIVLTEWNEFRQLDLMKLGKKLKSPVIFDGRNIYDPDRARKLGYTYYGVGRS